MGEVLSALGSMRRNIAALYAAQAARYALPLLLIPFLARVLGAEGWGLYSLGLSLALLLAVIVEYGFDLSATREVAQASTDRTRRSALFSDVLGAKLVLAALGLGLALAAVPFYPSLRGHPGVVVASFGFALAQGLSPLWYFAGLERLRLAAAIDVGGKVLGVLGVLAIVRSPDDAALALGIQAAANAAVLVLSFLLVLRDGPISRPTLAGAWRALRRGASIFLFRAAASLYTLANALVLGLFAPAASVGLYAAAERVARSATNVTLPVSQAAYPRLSRIAPTDAGGAARLARASFLATLLLACAASAALVVLAPWIVPALMGPGYEGAVPVMRVLALLPPLLAASNLLGIQWMLPHGMDRPFNAIILAGGALNLALALALAPRGGGLGMAAAVLCAEAFVTLAMFGYLRWRGRDPFVAAAQPADA